jgi:omega-6 fatty acid desaturase (delta-12 desaturase)
VNWILDHHTHHLTNGDITNKYHYTFNETTRLTYKQYAKMSFFGRAIAKFFLHPIVQFPLTPIIYYGFLQRFNYIVKKLKYKSKIQETMSMICFNHIINNIGIIGLYYTVYQYGYFYLFILYIYLSHIIGYLLFFNQHTFNPPYIVKNEEWNQRDSGLIGSSFIQIPWYLKYFFSGIEYHHIHHMNSKIPGYNLQRYHDEVEKNSNMFDNIVRLSMTDCYNNLWLAIYDEDDNKFLTIEDADNKLQKIKNE